MANSYYYVIGKLEVVLNKNESYEERASLKINFTCYQCVAITFNQRTEVAICDERCASLKR